MAKPSAPPLAQEFVKMLIEQEVLARDYGYGPVNRKAQVAEATARMAPVGRRAEDLIVVE